MTETRRFTAARVSPLVLATLTSQALLVVLAPTIAAIGAEFSTSVATVGQARTVTATTAIATSLALTARIRRIGVPRLLLVGTTLTLAGCVAVAGAPNLGSFLAAHLLVGVAFACLLTAGFAGVAAFHPADRARVIGYVTAANAAAWVVVNPIVGALTQYLSWRVSQAVVATAALATLLTTRLALRPVSEIPRTPPLRAVVGDRSARRWVISELLAYACWTGLLTYVGAFFIGRLDTGEATAGWLLAGGAAAYVLTSTQSTGLVIRMPRRRLVAGSGLAMAVLLPAMLGSAPLGVAAAALLFGLTGVAAGVRTPSSSGIGLDQLPGYASAMMAIRTGVTQLGYLIGAVVGGVVIAAAGYRTLGAVLGAGMAASALLILLVRDPTPS